MPHGTAAVAPPGAPGAAVPVPLEGAGAPGVTGLVGVAGRAGPPDAPAAGTVLGVPAAALPDGVAYGLAAFGELQAAWTTKLRKHTRTVIEATRN
ncbi:MAG: hypothetical protein ABW321_05245 [Polyangiales bacterium]